MTIKEALKNLKEIEGIVTDWLPVQDSDTWWRYMTTINKAKEALEYELMNEDDLK